LPRSLTQIGRDASNCVVSFGFRQELNAFQAGEEREIEPFQGDEDTAIGKISSVSHGRKSVTVTVSALLKTKKPAGKNLQVLVGLAGRK
jgi:hypothetical protein